MFHSFLRFGVVGSFGRSQFDDIDSIVLLLILSLVVGYHHGCKNVNQPTS